MSLIRKLVVLPSVAGFVLSANAFLSTAAAQPAGQPAAQPAATGADTVTKEKVIAGTMDIDFATRTNLDTSGDLKPNSPALGAKDTYKFTLSVAETTEFAGKIERQPNLFTKTLARRKQDAQLWYSIDLSLFNPRDLKVKKTVGKWVGTIPIDTASGAYDLSGGRAKESALRVKVDPAGTAPGFEDLFAGRLVGTGGGGHEQGAHGGQREHSGGLCCDHLAGSSFGRLGVVRARTSGRGCFAAGGVTRVARGGQEQS